MAKSCTPHCVLRKSENLDREGAHCVDVEQYSVGGIAVAPQVTARDGFSVELHILCPWSQHCERPGGPCIVLADLLGSTVHMGCSVAASKRRLRGPAVDLE